MSEKHPDRTSEWAKQQQALRNPKSIAIPPSLKNPKTGVAPSKETTDDKKDNQ